MTQPLHSPPPYQCSSGDLLPPLPGDSQAATRAQWRQQLSLPPWEWEGPASSPRSASLSLSLSLSRPPTRGLAHAQTEPAEERAVPEEAHGGVVLAAVGAQRWAQPQGEIPSLEAALVQLHSRLQGEPPAAQAPGGHAQHCVALWGLCLLLSRAKVPGPSGIGSCWVPGQRREWN